VKSPTRRFRRGFPCGAAGRVRSWRYGWGGCSGWPHGASSGCACRADLCGRYFSGLRAGSNAFSHGFVVSGLDRLMGGRVFAGRRPGSACHGSISGGWFSLRRAATCVTLRVLMRRWGLMWGLECQGAAWGGGWVSCRRGGPMCGPYCLALVTVAVIPGERGWVAGVVWTESEWVG